MNHHFNTSYLNPIQSASHNIPHGRRIVSRHDTEVKGLILGEGVKFFLNFFAVSVVVRHCRPLITRPHIFLNYMKQLPY